MKLVEVAMFVYGKLAESVGPEVTSMLLEAQASGVSPIEADELEAKLEQMIVEARAHEQEPSSQ